MYLLLLDRLLECSSSSLIEDAKIQELLEYLFSHLPKVVSDTVCIRAIFILCKHLKQEELAKGKGLQCNTDTVQRKDKLFWRLLKLVSCAFT